MIKYSHPSRELTFSFYIDVQGYKLKKVRMGHRQNRTGVMQRRLPDTNKVFHPRMHIRIKIRNKAGNRALNGT